MDRVKPKDQLESRAEENVEKREEGRAREAVQEPTRTEDSPGPSAAVEQKGSELPVKAKTGRAKRKEKRLRHEPHNVTGEQIKKYDTQRNM